MEPAFPSGDPHPVCVDRYLEYPHQATAGLDHPQGLPAAESQLSVQELMEVLGHVLCIHNGLHFGYGLCPDTAIKGSDPEHCPRADLLPGHGRGCGVYPALSLSQVDTGCVSIRCLKSLSPSTLRLVPCVVPHVDLRKITCALILFIRNG